jgi:hypothetical protein
MTTPSFPEAGGAAETLAVGQALPAAAADAAGAADGVTVVKGTAPAPSPGAGVLPAARVFTASAMPRMHLQNLVTGQWLHRDVRGITSPSITWVLNGPDTYTCTIAPPRPDLLDTTGNPVAQEWQTACYLEQADQIRFGGILTSSQFAGPAWTMGFTGFLGYPAGMVYEGSNYTQSGVDSLDVVRYLWSWLQGQPGSNLGVTVAATKSGVQLGGLPTGGTTQTTTLAKAANAGATQVTVKDPTGFQTGTQVVITGSNAQHAVTKISKSVLTLSPALGYSRPNGSIVYNLGLPVPYKLRWFNSTDIGQEIASIATETPFDQAESHSWASAAKQAVTHQVSFGVPRLGTRRLDLRFAEGENITEPVQGTRDGSGYASEVIGLGAGQGSAQIRAQVVQLDNRLRRTYVYTDGTVFTTARMTARAQRVLASRHAIDNPAQVVLRDHPNAPFGSFGPGDDILIIQATGWRQAATWARITQIQQDPTTQAMTLTCARSDSFTYQGTL